MSKINDGGPAFPQAHSDYMDHPVHGYIHREQGGDYPRPGMSLRQWYAGQAMTAVISLIGIPSDPNEPDDLWNDEIAKQCVGLADAVLKALEA